jgi:hypothetical protein
MLPDIGLAERMRAENEKYEREAHAPDPVCHGTPVGNMGHCLDTPTLDVKLTTQAKILPSHSLDDQKELQYIFGSRRLRAHVCEPEGTMPSCGYGGPT